MQASPVAVLQARRDAIADAWHRAIRHTSFVPWSAGQVSSRLAELVEQIISFLCAEQAESAQAQAIGAALAHLNYLQPEALGNTMEVLARQLAEGLSAEQIMAFQPRLALLLGGVAFGFMRHASATLLTEQEEIRSALLHDLRLAQTGLRQAHDQLEARVERRTRELASANEGLLLEIAERKRVEAALRESEEKFRSLAEQSPNMIFINRMGKVVYANRRAEELLGYNRAEYYADGFDFFTLVAPDYREEVLSYYRRHLEGAEVEPYQCALITRDGRRIEAIVATRLIEYEGERAILGIVTDITEQQRAAEALRESETRYRTLVETVRDGVYTLDAEGRFTFVNDVVARRSGHPREWFLGRSYLDVIRPEDRERARERFQVVMSGGQVPPYDLAFPTASGDLLWVETNTTALRADGAIAGMLGISRDVTERKRMEAALRESEERWRSLVENAPDLVLTLDREGRILFVNRPVTSPTAEAAQGKSVMHHGSPESDEALAAALQRVFETGELQRFEGTGPAPDGSTAWYGVRLGPIWRDGEVAAAMAVSRDITDRRRLEEMKDNLIRDVSHELRTPLAKMRMGMDLLMELIAAADIDRQRVAHIGEVIGDNVQRLLHTVEGILDLSVLEAGSTAFEMEPVQMAELIDEVAFEMQPLAEAKGLELVLALGDETGPVQGDRQQLYRVLVNLLDNAIKFSDEGQIVISSQRGEGELRIGVTDSGCGVLAANQERIFDRFFQEKASVQGIGVGLTICQAIVKAHGGRIWVESPGRDLGSTFWVALPLAET